MISNILITNMNCIIFSFWKTLSNFGRKLQSFKGGGAPNSEMEDCDNNVIPYLRI